MTGPDTIIAHQGETISHIAYRVYGSAKGRVEGILALNPKLCDLPAQLPMGTLVKLPARKNNDQIPIIPTINLTD